MTNTVRDAILARLAAMEFVSGEQLGLELGISRAAVNKHIKALTTLGLQIFSVTGKGYRLAQPLNLLNPSKIDEYVGIANHGPITVLTEIDSTNSYLLRKLHQGIQAGEAVVAEQQTAGRGRRGKTWVSPFASHIYFSMYWPIGHGMQGAMGLSVAVGLAVYDCLHALGIADVQLKWPNDIYVANKKLAGILVELEGQIDGLCHAVIGVGVNVNMDASSAKHIDQPWIDLASIQSPTSDRNLIIAELYKALLGRLDEYEKSGLTRMIMMWNSLNVHQDKSVKLISGAKIWRGVCKGINEQGGLLLQDFDGKTHAHYGGELTLRADSHEIID